MTKHDGKHIWVYAEWAELGSATLMGELTTTVVRGKEIFAFEYDEEWLSKYSTMYLDPDLALYKGRQYLQDDKNNFGMFLDSSPDRWGRVLMKRREALLAKSENRKEQTLFESDFLLGVYDPYRMGALRFSLIKGGEFLNNDKRLAAPPWASIRELEYASLQVEDENMNEEDSLKWLNMLIAPGSSLGGARPKAGVLDEKGQLWIAKFPSINDEKDIGAWELLLHQLAKKAGIMVSNAFAQKYSGTHHTFLTKRFDRTETKQRVHFASAMTLLGYKDGTDYTAGGSYLEIAEFIQRYGAYVEQDLSELWRRIVFNICVSNTDDHFRNHGFLLTEKGWKLSPAYDMNPVESGSGLTLNISETDNSLNTELALETAKYYRLTKAKAEDILTEVKTAVKEWREMANQAGIPRQQIMSMESAFNC
ncbi:MAG: HipA domain-containing protein [Bacteroidota bacterium]|nr:HipA domain-containing protein [Bacteroidota bacterium]